MSEFEPLHPPAPPEAQRGFFENPLLLQGLGLAALAIAALFAGARVARSSALLGLFAAPLFLVLATLASWAAAIHLTGGEKFDDHPWV